MSKDNSNILQNNSLPNPPTRSSGMSMHLTPPVRHSMPTITNNSRSSSGWLGVAKVSCIIRHRGVKLILAYRWARPAILIAGKGRGGMFLFLLFLNFHSCSFFFPVPLFHLPFYLFYLFSPFLFETTQNDPQGLTCS